MSPRGHGSGMRGRKAVDPAPCVQHSVFSCWINAWVTDRRFQISPRPCVLSTCCTGTDQIEHYGVCQHQWNAARRKLRLNSDPRNLARFMLVDLLPDDNLFLMACHVFAVQGVINHWRHHGRCPVEQVTAHIWERHRVVAKSSVFMTKVYKRIWLV